MTRRTTLSLSATLWLSTLTLAALALRVWRLGAMPLFADEAYYLLWSQRLAPGYYDHPAGVALLLRAATAVGGPSEFGVRWLNALLSALCVPLIFLLGRRYISPASGWIAAVAVAFGPVYVLTGRIAYPDSLQYILLLLNLLALRAILHSGSSTANWLWFGATLGALLNVKGTSLLYVAGLALYVLLWHRDWVRNTRAWLAAAIALLLWLPWLIWGAQHDWPSLRLAMSQGGGFGLEQATFLGSLAHAWRYLTPPAVLLALAACFGVLAETLRLAREIGLRALWRQPPPWTVLALTAGCLLLPMALSAANSPRNLALGLLPLWPLAGLLAQPDLQPRTTRLLQATGVITGGLLLLNSIGTVTALLKPTVLPQSSGAPAIRKDAAGWPEFGRAFTAPDADLLFAVDYSIAGQASYYTRRTVHSSIGQFRYWGLPDASSWTVLAQGYIQPERVTTRLEQDFATVAGPEAWTYRGPDGEKTIYIWHAQDRRAPTPKLVDDLDFLSLARQDGD